MLGHAKTMLSGCQRSSKTATLGNEPRALRSAFMAGAALACLGTASACNEPQELRVVSIGAGGFHSCALLSSGAVRCWGDGEFGQPGHGTTEDIGDDESPAEFGDVDVGALVGQISTGSFHTCVRTTDGSARCWGAGDNGRLGYGNTETIGDDEAVASVPAITLGSPIVSIEVGVAHTCALTEPGQVYCWGAGFLGALGHGSTDDVGDDEGPSQAQTDLGGTVDELYAGGFHNCVVLSEGSVRCWGDSEFGQLGYGDTRSIGDNELPSTAGPLDLGGPLQQLALGGLHSCALLTTGQVRCWGNGAFGQLGLGSTDHVGDDETILSVPFVDVGGSVMSIVAGNLHTCALLESGRVRCWGEAADGKLGYGNLEDIGDDESPSEHGDVPLGGMAVDITAGGGHTCALLDTGTVRCWGLGENGQLGYGTTDNIGDDESPESAGDVPVL